MRQPLTIAVAQPGCAPCDVAGNAAVHATVVRSAGARVAMFPELSLTGYELHAPALTLDDPRLAPLVEACAQVGAVALAGAPVAGQAGRRHIALLAVDATGVRVAYRKVHLGAAEAQTYTPGPGPAVLDVDGWRLGLAICRDTGIARHAADTAGLGMDVYVGAVAHHAHEADLGRQRARRVIAEHRVWVATASFAGPTGGGFARTAGRSAIWAPDGTLRAHAGPQPGHLARTTVQEQVEPGQC